VAAAHGITVLDLILPQWVHCLVGVLISFPLCD
jgi:hypothetical protein